MVKPVQVLVPVLKGEYTACSYCFCIQEKHQARPVYNMAFLRDLKLNELNCVGKSYHFLQVRRQAGQRGPAGLPHPAGGRQLHRRPAVGDHAGRRSGARRRQLVAALPPPRVAAPAQGPQAARGVLLLLLLLLLLGAVFSHPLPSRHHDVPTQPDACPTQGIRTLRSRKASCSSAICC